MLPPKLIHWTTDGEYIELCNFLIEKTKNAYTPLNIIQLTKHFKEESGTSRTVVTIRERIRSMRPRIHEMENVDTDTKVKMMFSLSASVNDDFLNELKTQAEVVVDDYQRIIKYKHEGGGLELEGSHVNIFVLLNLYYIQSAISVCRDIYGKKEAIRRDKRMIEFLAEKSKKVNSPVPERAFAREFQKITGATETNRYLNSRYNFLKKKIHDWTGIDQKNKIRMMFVSSASVPQSFLQQIRKDALVEVDEKNRITKYKTNDGSLELTGDHSHSAKTKAGLPGNVGEIIESNEESDGSSSDEKEFDSDDGSHLDETKDRTSSFKMVPLDVINEIIRELYADVVLYNEVSQLFPEFVPKMFNEATRKKLDAFLKVNEARRLKDIVTDRMFKKKKRTSSTPNHEPPSKKVGAEESSSSDSSDEEAVKKICIRNPVNVVAKRAAVQKKHAPNISDSDSDIPVKKWTPPKKSAQTPAQKKAASSSDSGSEDEATKKISVFAQKAASKKVYSVSSSSPED